jgi:small ligand-binding sensory domain FIST
MSFDSVTKSTDELISEVARATAGKGLLIYSCTGRNWALGTKWTSEHEVMRKWLGDTPYSFCYAGGEIFPDQISDGKTANHLQNVSVIVCAL